MRNPAKKNSEKRKADQPSIDGFIKKRMISISEVPAESSTSSDISVEVTEAQVPLIKLTLCQILLVAVMTHLLKSLLQSLILLSEICLKNVMAL